MVFLPQREGWAAQRNARALGAAVAVLTFVLVLMSGCAMNETTATRPARAPVQLLTASKQQLVAQYNAQAMAVTSINASITMTLTAGSSYKGVIKQYHQVTGFILAQKPSDIRVIGQAPVVGTNIFDMQSDGQTFHIFIPSENKFVVGPANLERPSEKPIENLRPQHLTDAIFWRAMPAGTPVLFEEASDGAGRYYVLTVVRTDGQKRGDEAGEGAGGAGAAASGATGGGAAANSEWEIARKIWFDRSSVITTQNPSLAGQLEIARIETYDASGKIESDVRYAGWDVFGGDKYPRQISIDRPESDYQLQIGITKLTIGQPVTPDRFVLKQPAGTQLVNVGEENGGKSGDGASDNGGDQAVGKGR
jgi:outer membrane lipoprotein-sorting protein